MIIGAAAPNQSQYYNNSRKLAAPNITFIDYLPQEELASYYQKAKVHILPSWFETCGLSSLEAAAMGCNIVITDKGYTREYFEDYAFYCDPASPESIRRAIDQAANAPYPDQLGDKILNNYTWQQAAEKPLQLINWYCKKMNLRIGILGTRGIPNNYGGFEYFAEHLSQGLVKRAMKYMFIARIITPTSNRIGMAYIFYTAMIPSIY